jgi:hypothetical protein
MDSSLSNEVYHRKWENEPAAQGIVDTTGLWHHEILALVFLLFVFFIVVIAIIMWAFPPHMLAEWLTGKKNKSKE